MRLQGGAVIQGLYVNDTLLNVLPAACVPRTEVPRVALNMAKICLACLRTMPASTHGENIALF